MTTVNKSKEAVGKYGYTHWTGLPVTPGTHTIVYVPQTIADGYEAYCSCGEWRAFASYYQHDTKASLKAALDEAFAGHRQEND